MSYTFDDTKPRSIWEKGKANLVPPAGMRGYYEWRRRIRSGTSPADAAKNMEYDMNFEKLAGQYNHYTIRLTQYHRVLFTISNNKVEVISIGGHQKKHK